MTSRTIPADDDAERAVLGACLLSVDAVRTAAAILDPSDWYRPTHAAVWAAVRAVHATGGAVDVTSVSAALRDDGHGDPDGGWSRYLSSLAADGTGSNNVRAWAMIVADRSARRRLIAAASTIMDGAYDLTADLDDVRDVGTTDVASAGRVHAPRRHPSLDAWADTVDMSYDWVVPDVLESRDRMIVVAKPGVGKSMILRQMAMMVSCGVHWFTHARTIPQAALAIDVENSGRQIVRQTRRLRSLADAWVPDRDPEKIAIIPYPRLDLTRRADRLDVESYLAGHRPRLLTIGPLYKLFPSDPGRTYEQNAAIAQDVLDDWRARYDVALLMEHHSSKGDDLDPTGSFRWTAWPEFSTYLRPDKDNPAVAEFGHSRIPRETRAFPSTLVRGRADDWPWIVPPDDPNGPAGGRF